jgi:hypothetical protein
MQSRRFITTQLVERRYNIEQLGNPKDSDNSRNEATSIKVVIPLLPDRHDSTALVQDWIRAWHVTHISIDSNILSSVTWDGSWIYEQPPAQLKSELFDGVFRGEGKHFTPIY